MFDKPKKGSSVDRIVGGTEKERGMLRRTLNLRFEHHHIYEYFKRHEREKTPFELEAIGIANAGTDALREKYGLPVFKIPTQNIHVLRNSAAADFDFQGGFSLSRQAFVLIDMPTRINTLRSIFHEMVHFTSFSSVEPQETDLKIRRGGLESASIDSDTPAFTPLNEAVTEELTKRFMRSVEDEGSLKEEVVLLRKVRENLGPQETEDVLEILNVSVHPDGDTEGDLHTFGYIPEREALGILIEKLQKHDPRAFRDKEACFDMFASAMFNGHLLELARAIEGAFGEGKFRELGQQQTGEEMLQFVESL